MTRHFQISDFATAGGAQEVPGRRWLPTRGDRPAMGRSWLNGPYPATDAELRDHLRMSLGRTAHAALLAGAAFVALGLVAAVASL